MTGFEHDAAATRFDPAPHAVLVVDDKPVIASLFTMMLEAMGVEVCGTAGTAEAAVALAQRRRPGLVLMDVGLPGPADGVDAGVLIRDTVGCPVIYVTGSCEPETLARIRSSRPAAVLTKPVPPEEFRRAVRQVMG